MAVDRLVSVSPEIKAHRLWAGSTEEMSFRFGGVRESQVRDMLAKKAKCSDLTPSEREWMRLWEAALKAGR